MISKNKRVLKLLAAFSAFIFTANTILWSAPSLPAVIQDNLPGEQRNDSSAFPGLPFIADLPSELGTVQDGFSPEHVTSDSKKNGPFVIHIQDAHANPEAQARIRDILTWIYDRAQRSQEASSFTIALEGAAGPIHPDYFELFPDFPEANEALVQDLHHKGEVTGAELFAWEQYKKQRLLRRSDDLLAMTSTSPSSLPLKGERIKVRGNQKTLSLRAKRSNLIPIAGVEDPALYRDNLKTYRDLLFQQNEIETALQPLQARLEIAKSKILNPQLRDFLKEKERRKNDLATYVSRHLTQAVSQVLEIDLNNRIEQFRFPNLARFLYFHSQENQMDPKAASQEWAVLKKELLQAGIEAKVVETLDSFQSDPQKRDIPLRQIFEHVLSLLKNKKKKNIRFKKFPHYVQWIGFNLLSREIESSEFFREIERLEHAVEEKLAQNKNERRLLKLYYDFILLEKLLRLELTRIEYHDLISRKEKIYPQTVMKELAAIAAVPKASSANGFLKNILKKKKKDNSLPQFFDRALDFYTKAQVRDRILLENALKLVPSRTQPAHSGRSILVLITGGFHTEGITELIKEKQLTYAVVTPRMTQVEENNLYQKVLRRENADLTPYFKNSWLNKQEALFFKGLLEQALPVLVGQYQIPAQALPVWFEKAVQNHPVLQTHLQAAVFPGQEQPFVRLNFRSEIVSIPATARAVSEVLLTGSMYDRLSSSSLYHSLMNHPLRDNPAVDISFGKINGRAEVKQIANAVLQVGNLGIESGPLPFKVSSGLNLSLRSEVRNNEQLLQQTKGLKNLRNDLLNRDRNEDFDKRLEEEIKDRFADDKQPGFEESLQHSEIIIGIPYYQEKLTPEFAVEDLLEALQQPDFKDKNITIIIVGERGDEPRKRLAVVLENLKIALASNRYPNVRLHYILKPLEEDKKVKTEFTGKPWSVRALIQLAAMANKNQGSDLLIIDADIRFEKHSDSAFRLLKALLGPLSGEEPKTFWRSENTQPGEQPADIVTLEARRNFNSDDGIIHFFTYLMTHSLFGINTREAHGGEFALSGRFVKALVSSPSFHTMVHDNAYELEYQLLEQAVLLKGMKVTEGQMLGKTHQEVSPTAIFERLYLRFFGPFFDDMIRYQDYWTIGNPVVEVSARAVPSFEQWIRTDRENEKAKTRNIFPELYLKKINHWIEKPTPDPNKTENERLQEFPLAVSAFLGFYDETFGEIGKKLALYLHEEEIGLQLGINPFDWGEFTGIFLKLYADASVYVDQESTAVDKKDKKGKKADQSDSLRKFLIHAYVPIMLLGILYFGNYVHGTKLFSRIKQDDIKEERKKKDLTKWNDADNYLKGEFAAQFKEGVEKGLRSKIQEDTETGPRSEVRGGVTAKELFEKLQQEVPLGFRGLYRPQRSYGTLSATFREQYENKEVSIQLNGDRLVLDVKRQFHFGKQMYDVGHIQFNFGPDSTHVWSTIPATSTDSYPDPNPILDLKYERGKIIVIVNKPFITFLNGFIKDYSNYGNLETDPFVFISESDWRAQHPPQPPVTRSEVRSASPSKADVKKMIEKQKDRYAQIAGNEKREKGYEFSLKKLKGEEKILAILQDQALAEPDRTLVAQVLAFGKGGIFHFWNELNPDEKRALMEQLKTINLEDVERFYQRFIVRKEQGAAIEVTSNNIQAPEVNDLTKGKTNENQSANHSGESAYRKGEVAFLELAGGTGSRLGYSHPKMMFKASQVMNKSLARMRAEKIRAMAEEYGRPIPWIIMTSDVTHAETEEFFNEHIINGRYFGQVPVEWVRFIRQSIMPQVTDNGEFILEEKNKIAVGGFGHGDARDWVLRNKEIQNWLLDFGIQYVVMVNVDNAFLPGAAEVGYHLLSGQGIQPGVEHLSVLVAEKTNPTESVGLAVLLNGKDGMIEYSQFPPELVYFKYTYEMNHKRFLIYKGKTSDGKTSDAYHILSFEDFSRDIKRLGLKEKELEKWFEEHLMRLEDLPGKVIIHWSGREYTKDNLQKAHLWLRLGNTNTLIWDLKSFLDDQHPLPLLPELVARNKAVGGYNPETFIYHTKDSKEAVKANKFERMAFHGFLAQRQDGTKGETKGAHIIVPRVGGFAPIKEKSGMDTPERAAEIYSQNAREMLMDKVNWNVSEEAVVELSPAFSFLDGRYLGEKLGNGDRPDRKERLGENGFIGENTQLYLSGKNSRIGRNFRLEEGVQFILRIDDEYNPKARVDIGNDVTVQKPVTFHLEGSGRVIVEDGVTFDYPLQFMLKEGEWLHIDEGTITKVREMLERDNNARGVYEAYVFHVENKDLKRAVLIRKLADSYFESSLEDSPLHQAAAWLRDQISQFEAERTRSELRTDIEEVLKNINDESLKKKLADFFTLEEYKVQGEPETITHFKSKQSLEIQSQDGMPLHFDLYGSKTGERRETFIDVFDPNNQDPQKPKKPVAYFDFDVASKFSSAGFIHGASVYSNASDAPGYDAAIEVKQPYRQRNLGSFLVTLALYFAKLHHSEEFRLSHVEAPEFFKKLGFDSEQDTYTFDLLKKPLPAFPQIESSINRSELRSPYHEQLGHEYLEGRIQVPTRKLIRKMEPSEVDLDLEPGSPYRTSDEQVEAYTKLALKRLQQAKRTGEKFLNLTLLAGESSRMGKGKIAELVLQALDEDAEQFVDKKKLTAEDVSEIQKRSGLQKYISALVTQARSSNGETAEKLKSILYSPKALAPAAKVNGKWYNFLAFNFKNVAKANDEMEKAGYGRPFVAGGIINEKYDESIKGDLAKNLNYGLKDEEVLIFFQPLGYGIAGTPQDVEEIMNDERKKFQAGKIKAEERDFQTEEDIQFAIQYAQAHQGEVLYELGQKAEGHGWTFPSMLLMEGDVKEPAIVTLNKNKIREVLIHNLDNMMTLDDHWLASFGMKITKNKLTVHEMADPTEAEKGHGGGAAVVEVNGAPQRVQMEWDIFEASAKEHRIDLDKEIERNPLAPFSNGIAQTDMMESFNLLLGKKFQEALKIPDAERNKALASLVPEINKRLKPVPLKRAEKIEVLEGGKKVKRPVVRVIFELRAWEIQEADLTRVGIVHNASFETFKGNSRQLLEQDPAQLMKGQFGPLKTMDNYDLSYLQDHRTAKVMLVVDPEYSLFHFPGRSELRNQDEVKKRLPELYLEARLRELRRKFDYSAHKVQARIISDVRQDENRQEVAFAILLNNNVFKGDRKRFNRFRAYLDEAIEKDHQKIYLPDFKQWRLALVGRYTKTVGVPFLENEVIELANDLAESKIKESGLGNFEIQIEEARLTSDGSIVLDIEESDAIFALRVLLLEALEEALEKKLGRGLEEKERNQFEATLDTSGSISRAGVVTIGRVLPKAKGLGASIDDQTLMEIDAAIEKINEDIIENPLYIGVDKLSLVQPSKEFLEDLTIQQERPISLKPTRGIDLYSTEVQRIYEVLKNEIKREKSSFDFEELLSVQTQGFLRALKIRLENLAQDWETGKEDINAFQWQRFLWASRIHSLLWWLSDEQYLRLPGSSELALDEDKKSVKLQAKARESYFVAKGVILPYQIVRDADERYQKVIAGFGGGVKIKTFVALPPNTGYEGSGILASAILQALLALRKNPQAEAVTVNSGLRIQTSSAGGSDNFDWALRFGMTLVHGAFYIKNQPPVVVQVERLKSNDLIFESVDLGKQETIDGNKREFHRSETADFLKYLKEGLVLAASLPAEQPITPLAVAALGSVLEGLPEIAVYGGVNNLAATFAGGLLYTTNQPGNYIPAPEVIVGKDKFEDFQKHLRLFNPGLRKEVKGKISTTGRMVKRSLLIGMNKAETFRVMTELQNDTKQMPELIQEGQIQDLVEAINNVQSWTNRVVHTAKAIKNGSSKETSKTLVTFLEFLENVEAIYRLRTDEELAVLVQGAGPIGGVLFMGTQMDTLDKIMEEMLPGFEQKLQSLGIFDKNNRPAFVPFGLTERPMTSYERIAGERLEGDRLDHFLGREEALQNDIQEKLKSRGLDFENGVKLGDSFQLWYQSLSVAPQHVDIEILLHEKEALLRFSAEGDKTPGYFTHVPVKPLAEAEVAVVRSEVREGSSEEKMKELLQGNLPTVQFQNQVGQLPVTPSIKNLSLEDIMKRYEKLGILWQTSESLAAQFTPKNIFDLSEFSPALRLIQIAYASPDEASQEILNILSQEERQVITALLGAGRSLAQQTSTPKVNSTVHVQLDNVSQNTLERFAIIFPVLAETGVSLRLNVTGKTTGEAARKVRLMREGLSSLKESRLIKKEQLKIEPVTDEKFPFASLPLERMNGEVHSVLAKDESALRKVRYQEGITRWKFDNGARTNADLLIADILTVITATALKKQFTDSYYVDYLSPKNAFPNLFSEAVQGITAYFKAQARLRVAA